MEKTEQEGGEKKSGQRFDEIVELSSSGKKTEKPPKSEKEINEELKRISDYFP